MLQKKKKIVLKSLISLLISKEIRKTFFLRPRQNLFEKNILSDVTYQKSRLGFNLDFVRCQEKPQMHLIKYFFQKKNFSIKLERKIFQHFSRMV